MCNFKEYNRIFIDTINNFNEIEVEDIFGELEENVDEIAEVEGFDINEAFDIASTIHDDIDIVYNNDVINLLSDISYKNIAKDINGVFVSSDMADRILEVYSLLDRNRKEKMKQFSINTLMRIINSLGV